MSLSTMLRLTATSLLLRRLAPTAAPLPRFLSAAPRPRRALPLRAFSSAATPRSDAAEKIVPAAVSGGGGDGEVQEGRVVVTELQTEAKEAYMAYAMSVLFGRALPDVRDGLKPVHRRILYAMHELGLSSRKPFKKCARVVGEVLGKFHPHGDTAVYETLVRMAQDFSLRYPLINGHGNFGSIDADPPAAMRYTECRLEALTEAMLLMDLELDTVNFVPNFDSSQKEPSLLPARIPTLLLNGSSGIAVGMATNIPPHNLGELVDALSFLINNPEATVRDLLEHMPGPDFPTGGIIMGNHGILQAYTTGRGRLIVRGKTEIELLDERSKRSGIIVKEVPYQVNKAALVERIAELVEAKTIEGVSDIRDESDRSGMRLVIELKRGANPSVVLNKLFRHTALQCSFSCNMVGIINGQPKVMSLIDMLQAFLDFRCSVIERRTRFKLSQAQERKHIVEGVILGLDNLDGVINIIRGASSNAIATKTLVKEYGLSDKQAEAILDITLRKLTSLERNKFVDEGNSLAKQTSELNELLSSKKNILQLIEQEAIELKKKFDTPRRSLLDDDDGGVDDLDVIPNEKMLLTITEKGYVKRMKHNTFNVQQRGTFGKSVGKMRQKDSMNDFVICQAHDHILYFSDKGRVYSNRAYRIPECSRTATGTALIQLLSLTEGERITSLIPVSEFTEDQYLLMLTVNGFIKRVSLNVFSAIRSTGIIAISLVPGDELKWVRCCANDDLVTIASQNGRVIVGPCNQLRASGRGARGFFSMKLKEGDKIASVDTIPADPEILQKFSGSLSSRTPDLGPPWLLFVSESGLGKRVPLSKFRFSSIKRTGLTGFKLLPGDRIVAVFVVGFSIAEDGESDEQVVLVSQSGTVNRMKVRDIPIKSRITRGVILMRLGLAGKIQSTSLISAATDELDDVEEAVNPAATGDHVNESLSV